MKNCQVLYTSLSLSTEIHFWLLCILFNQNILQKLVKEDVFIMTNCLPYLVVHLWISRLSHSVQNIICNYHYCGDHFSKWRKWRMKMWNLYSTDSSISSNVLFVYSNEGFTITVSMLSSWMLGHGSKKSFRLSVTPVQREMLMSLINNLCNLCTTT